MASYDVSKLILPNGDECVLKDSEAREDLDNAKAKLDNMGMVSYGTCSTSANAQVKVVTISNDNWQLKIGSIIGVKYSNTNKYNATASAPVKLNVNSTGEKQIYYSSSAAPTGTNTTAFGYANQYRYYMYDGTYWVFMGLSYHDNSFPSAYCSTVSETAAKAASCSGYQLLTKSYLHIVVTNTNTSANALTLNVNGKGAKPIYINGAASSSSNYTLPAGSYIIYYDGTNYYFRTDGKLTADITGTASGALSLAGGTLTGGLSITGATTGLTVSYAGNTAIKVNDTGRGHSIELRSWSDRKQGLWTPGYASDSAYNSSEKWLIYRDKDGKVYVGDHYSAEEVDAKLSNLRLMRVTIIKDNNNADITIPAGNTSEGAKTISIDLKEYNYIDNDIKIYDAVSAWLGGWRLPYIDNNGVVKTWISRIDQNKALTITNLTGAWPLSTYPLYLTLLVY